MGLFDGLLGKKDTGDIVLEPVKGGYVLKGGPQAKAPGISGVYVFFNGKGPIGNEPAVLADILKEFNVPGKLAPGALIKTAYEDIPGIDEYVATQEMPESLNAFFMARAMMAGMARSAVEMSKLALHPFDHKGVKGVLILKEA